MKKSDIDTVYCGVCKNPVEVALCFGDVGLEVHLAPCATCKAELANLKNEVEFWNKAAHKAERNLSYVVERESEVVELREQVSCCVGGETKARHQVSPGTFDGNVLRIRPRAYRIPAVRFSIGRGIATEGDCYE